LRSRTAAILLIACWPALAQEGGLLLRAFEQPPAGEAMGVGPQGVQVRSSQGDVVIVGWDRVLRAPASLAEAAEAYDRFAIDTWRARTRVERGDLVLAEPLFQAIFESAGDDGPVLRGPTGLVVAEGLLRCRLARGASAAALEPWLAWIDASIVRQPRTTFAHRDWAQQAGLPPVIDAGTELCPLLPPMWLETPSLQLVVQLEPVEGERDKAAAMRALYQAAARHALGRPVNVLPDVPRETASELVRDIVAARVLDEQARASARARLESALPNASAPWLAAWIRAALGRSLVLEEDEEAKLRGVAQLLRVHVLHREDVPALADVALAEAAATLASLGQGDSARSLATELARVSPQSPVLSWAGLADVLEAVPAANRAPASDPLESEEPSVGGTP
jgi:hypothetical protein